MTNERSEGQPVFAESLRTLTNTVTNPLFLFGGGVGILGGWIICWCLSVLPFHGNMKELQTQLKKWSQLNQQMLTNTMENRELSQTELKQFVAMNQKAATQFMEVQRLLHDREIRMTSTSASFFIIPICILIVTLVGIVMILKSLHSRALLTVEHVVVMAPREMVQEIVARHIAVQPVQMRHVLPAPAPANADD